ncbi:hypothetical protein [Erythrobacter sp. EC-HK427]|uniref:hypothetical protein n=1 Tax=Erythrobacter sp. EC-HK427 TaxID=2038396 RepID=UPI001254B606|nr:hypothetical protein [Erythrobacter sp. EC-HK427]VVT07171.1 hypothetical protein ERY430_41467 [Erythrobacter sp. EC-HK427]
MRRGPFWRERRAADDRRRDELADLRIQRPLTKAERAEEAKLEKRLQMQVWQEMQREREAAFATGGQTR